MPDQKKWSVLNIAKKVLCVCAALVLVGVMIFAWKTLSMTFSKSDDELRQDLEGLSRPYGFHYHTSDSHRVRYVRALEKERALPILLTIHGAPGSSNDFSSYWHIDELNDVYEIISIDRPGYGGSYSGGKDVLIEDQAEIILDLIADIASDRPISLLTHSYGGPVGALVAEGLDSLCLGHLMIAPVIDPDSEEVFWYAGAPLWWPFSQMATQDWKVASYEKLRHVSQLENLRDRWSNIKSPTVHIHGTADWLASIDNVAFCKEYFNLKYYKEIIIEDADHFILWNDDIKRQAIGILENWADREDGGHF